MSRKTIARVITAEGTALHAGAKIWMTLSPAEPGTGIVFRRADLKCHPIPAKYDRVTETKLGTVIAEEQGESAAVIEHLMAALAGAEIDDILIDIDGPEPPILDGDALSYLKVLDLAGVREQPGKRIAIRVLQRVDAVGGSARAALLPSDTREFVFDIEFPSAAIGKEHMSWTFSPNGFRDDIAPARTFGFISELEGLRRMGLGRGATLENTLALDGDTVLNAKLIRFPDEFVRHKILDAVGDLALAGGPVIGRFEGIRSGHSLNNALLRTLFADPGNYELVEI